MNHLGKLFLILTFFNIALNAGVTASVNSKTASIGDSIILSLKIVGENIQRPQIIDICGEEVISSSATTNMTIVKMQYKKEYILKYAFKPKKDCIIESIEVDIDSNTYTTRPIEIKIVKRKKSIYDDFSLEIISNKKNVYIGEEFYLTLIFKQRHNANALESRFIEPKFNGFWIKNKSEQKSKQTQEHTIIEFTYTLSAQRSGNLSISPAEIKIATRENTNNSFGFFTPAVNWQSYFSNDIDINAKALPIGVKLVGNFKISASIDKNILKQNEAVNVVVKVEGTGNLEDIQSFKQEIDGVSVFDEKISIEDSTLTQNLAFVSEKDFSIQMFSLKFLNVHTGKIETISTKKIDVKIEKNLNKQKLMVKSPKKNNEEIQSTQNKIGKNFSIIKQVLIFFLGLGLGITLMILKSWKFKKTDRFNYKNKKLLLVKLIPYKDEDDVKSIFKDIEDYIYKNKTQDIDNKKIIKIIKKYNIS